MTAYQSGLILRLYNYVLLFILLIGGIGIESVWLTWSGLFVFALGLFLLILNNKRLSIPDNFLVYVTVVILLVVNLFYTQKIEAGLKYLFLFLGGGMLWLYSYNYKKFNEFKRTFILGVLFLGLFYLQYVLIEKWMGVASIKSFAVTGYSGANNDHHHLGDFFSVIGSLAFGNFLLAKGKRAFWVACTAFSLVVIIFSQSRSALFSLAVSSILFLWQMGYLINFRKYLWAFYILISVTFLYLAQFKTILFSRPYFVQGVASLANNPFGVGMGNFSAVSVNPENHILGASGFSTVAHNLPIEFLAGMGIMGTVFIYFFIKVFFLALKRIRHGELFMLIFINLSVNFLADFTYAIPTMLWLWFIALGILGRGREAKSNL